MTDAGDYNGIVYPPDDLEENSSASIYAATSCILVISTVPFGL